MEIISLADFQKLDIRIGKVLHAEKIEGTDKLIRLEVDLGVETKQIVTGMAEFFDCLRDPSLSSSRAKECRRSNVSARLQLQIATGHRPVHRYGLGYRQRQVDQYSAKEELLGGKVSRKHWTVQL